jgi:hypothetical protein
VAILLALRCDSCHAQSPPVDLDLKADFADGYTQACGEIFARHGWVPWIVADSPQILCAACTTAPRSSTVQ